MLTILASYAQEESLSASENQKWRVRKGFESGELVNWRFMFGYDIQWTLEPSRDVLSSLEMSLAFAGYYYPMKPVGGQGGALLDAYDEPRRYPRLKSVFMLLNSFGY